MKKQIKLTPTILREMIEESIKNYYFLNESKGNRIQISRDDILKKLNETDDDPRSGGKWATITYVHTASVYKQKKNLKTKEIVWRNNDVQSALDKHSDRSGEDWHKKLSAFNQEDNDTKSKNPVSSIVLANRYMLHWHTQEDYGKDAYESGERLRQARMRIGVAIPSDGYLGDNHNQRQKNGWAQFNQTGNLSRDFNMAKMDKKKLKSFIFLCDDNGDVITELPEDVYFSMIAKSSLKPEKDVAAIATPEQLEAYMEVKKQESKVFKPKNLLLDRILCIAASVNGESYYYINDKLSVPINSRKGAANINRQTMIELAEKLLDENFNVLDNYAIENHKNVFGDTNESIRRPFRNFANKKRQLNEVNRNYRHGHVSNDGNSMVGGDWASWDCVGYCNILEKFSDNLSDRYGNEYNDEVDDFIDYCYDNEDEFTLNATFNATYDESTGYGSSYSPVYELQSIDGDSQIKDFIMNYPSNNEDLKEIAIDVLEDTIDSLDDYDFEIEN